MVIKPVRRPRTRDDTINKCTETRRCHRLNCRLSDLALEFEVRSLDRDRLAGLLHEDRAAIIKDAHYLAAALVQAWAAHNPAYYHSESFLELHGRVHDACGAALQDLVVPADSAIFFFVPPFFFFS